MDDLRKVAGNGWLQAAQDRENRYNSKSCDETHLISY